MDRAAAPAGGGTSKAKAIATLLHELYIGVAGAELRREDHQKTAELEGLLAELDLLTRRLSRQRPLAIVDAACGKGYVGLLALASVLRDRPVHLVGIEQEARRVSLAREAAGRLGVAAQVEVRQGDVADAALWPKRPDLVVALHACGPAFDATAERAIGAGAAALLLVPCCTGRSVAAAGRAERLAARWGVPRHAEVRRRFVQALVDAERTLRLEVAGYQVEVVAFVAPTVTPHNLVWRARRVGEPGRMRRAADELATLLAAMA